MTIRAAVVRVGRAGTAALAVATALVLATGGVSGAEGTTGADGAHSAGGVNSADGASGPGGGSGVGGAGRVDGGSGAEGAWAGRGRAAGGDGTGYDMRTSARFAPPGAFLPSRALTYDMNLVPAGAWIEVEQRSDSSGTRVAARLRGLVPDRAYGMHVHTSPCGADPKAAGPHYQHRASATADPANEVWLDFRTDRYGNGSARARHGWGFREGGARSVIIHDAQGGAGARAACFSVPFGVSGRG
ncbi:superoxide dismutase family protein [Streptomyces sp. BE147]|uniref:superoxide dismutase family protein n=1 Tax=Streptomyces sp. BE147 TaxID=3002524 RepID=UPI002E77A734|nr:superoxide dismutase family protein [Streptomyces sp. BE147]MEE1738553.1 superoxide dismutase family protein [Streptomyces sp. BE147]